MPRLWCWHGGEALLTSRLRAQRSLPLLIHFTWRLQYRHREATPPKGCSSKCGGQEGSAKMTQIPRPEVSEQLFLHTILLEPFLSSKAGRRSRKSREGQVSLSHTATELRAIPAARLKCPWPWPAGDSTDGSLGHLEILSKIGNRISTSRLSCQMDESLPWYLRGNLPLPTCPGFLCEQRSPGLAQSLLTPSASSWMGFLTLLCQHLCYLSLLISSCYTAPGLLARQKQCPDPSHTQTLQKPGGLQWSWSWADNTHSFTRPQLPPHQIVLEPGVRRMWASLGCLATMTSLGPKWLMWSEMRSLKAGVAPPPHHDCRAGNVMRKKGTCLLPYSVQQQLKDSDLGPPSTFLHPMYFLVPLTAPPGIT